jgi:ATP synthase subunit 6
MEWATKSEPSATEQQRLERLKAAAEQQEAEWYAKQKLEYQAKLDEAAANGTEAGWFFNTPLEQFELLSPEQGNQLLASQTYSLLPLLLTLGLVAALIFHRPRLLGGHSPQLLAELLVRRLGSFLEANASRAQLPHLPLLLLLVLSLGLYNLSGLLPYNFTFSAHLVVTLFYSLSLFFGLNYLALLRHQLHYFNLFLPSGTPLGLQPLMVLLELVSYLSRPFSLAIRLFANLMAGHALLKILLSFSQRGLEGSTLAKLRALLALVTAGPLVAARLGFTFLGVGLAYISASRNRLEDRVLHWWFSRSGAHRSHRSQASYYWPGVAAFRHRLATLPMEVALLRTLPQVLLQQLLLPALVLWVALNWGTSPSRMLGYPQVLWITALGN